MTEQQSLGLLMLIGDLRAQLAVVMADRDRLLAELARLQPEE